MSSYLVVELDLPSSWQNNVDSTLRLCHPRRWLDVKIYVENEIESTSKQRWNYDADSMPIIQCRNNVGIMKLIKRLLFSFETTTLIRSWKQVENANRSTLPSQRRNNVEITSTSIIQRGSNVAWGTLIRRLWNHVDVTSILHWQVDVTKSTLVQRGKNVV